MILWHLGIAATLVYVTLGRSRIDYRFILAGAILPDVIDSSLVLFGVIESTSLRGPAHSLIFVAVDAIAIILLFKAERRLAVFGISVGWLTHLVGDGMWNSPKTFLWPLFGNSFEATPAEPYSWDLFTSPFDHLSTWGAELAGLALIIWFVIAFGLKDPDRRRLFLKDGYLRP